MGILDVYFWTKIGWLIHTIPFQVYALAFWFLQDTIYKCLVNIKRNSSGGCQLLHEGHHSVIPWTFSVTNFSVFYHVLHFWFGTLFHLSLTKFGQLSEALYCYFPLEWYCVYCVYNFYSQQKEVRGDTQIGNSWKWDKCATAVAAKYYTSLEFSPCVDGTDSRIFVHPIEVNV